MDWPFLFEGHTLEREFKGLRCTKRGKRASDIAGRPRWSYFRQFRCVPKRRRGRPRRPSQLVAPLVLEEVGASQVRPRRAARRSRTVGLAEPPLLREAQEPLVGPGRPASRGPSLLREAQDPQ
eukprot:5902408-Amphidinium_carterae.1